MKTMADPGNVVHVSKGNVNSIRIIKQTDRPTLGGERGRRREPTDRSLRNQNSGKN